MPGRTDVQPWACAIQASAAAPDAARPSASTLRAPSFPISQAPPPHPSSTVTMPPAMPMRPTASSSQPASTRYSLDRP
ncbi:hypothetical protein G6F64_014875 [Rhizopus arrhizus]|uniref:Uncharacterized protein n=1 Tax=Rhizopus oryzae TaxID=64495 RepID=A0A9P6WSN2_RHIOR|nr:hypothetical protein G6F64_014875 [Rhizopus arrhizus]